MRQNTIFKAVLPLNSLWRLFQEALSTFMMQQAEFMRDMRIEFQQVQSEIREMQSEVKGLQVENRRILQQMFGDEF